jgi:hypothetical protein
MTTIATIAAGKSQEKSLGREGQRKRGLPFFAALTFALYSPMLIFPGGRVYGHEHKQ